MAVEIVILAPVLFMFAMLVVAGGRYVGVEGDIEAAARDAARAASLETTRSEAIAAASATASASFEDGDLDADCTTVVDPSNWGPDGSIRVVLNCSVPYDGLGLIGLPGSVDIEAESTVRLDPYRKYES
ncbi:TadE family protein [Nocardioides immobilis]|nr:TadE family protein [Nocardioides immobilis]